MSISGQDSPVSPLLHPDVQRFIKAHESSDVHTLSLQHDSVHGIPFARIAEQIAGRQKARLKLPQYFAAGCILYPPAINLEQCSSEMTARFKTELLAKCGLPDYTSCADLTGGFGVDSLYLSRIFGSLHFVEPDAGLLSLARHNHECLDARNIAYHNTHAESFLRDSTMHFGAVYLDPSRRPGMKGKVIELTAYAPDVRSVLPLIQSRTRHTLLKTSPMLDIQRGLEILPPVTRVVVVAVNNEVRELLFLLDSRHSDDPHLPHLEAVNLMNDRIASFSFNRMEEQASIVQYEDPGRYLYEPNAAILKAGAFKAIAARFGLPKLHPNTHLYTSDTLVTDFPGRVFEVETLSHGLSPALMSYFPDGSANVIVRNYPLSADQLKVRAGLRDGGVNYLIGFTSRKGKMLAAARRIVR